MKGSAKGDARPPVVDLANFEQRKEEIRQQLMDAATVQGFFYITGHGIPEDLISAAWKTSERFFQQPDDAKQALPKVDWAKAEVIGFERNNLSDGTIHESMMTSYEVHDQMKTAWPKEDLVPGFRETTLEVMTSMQPVVQRILSCFAEALGFPSNFFDETIDVDTVDNRTFLQYHKYPSVEGMKWKPGTNRITAHTDESLITLLYTSPSSVGLELAAGTDGAAVEGVTDGLHRVENWTPCPPLPGCITVNIGDPLQLWSDGLLKSNYHRVRMPTPEEPQGDRYSIGYFVWPRLHDRIEGQKGVYPPTTMAKYMEKKGKNFAESFSPDIATYEAQQEYSFGLAANTIAVA